MVARDVEGAIRAHDYIEAMRVLRSALATPAEINAVNFASVRLLLRPSVGIAAAISEDEGALRILDSLAAAVPEDYPGRRAALDKAASNWTSLEMVRWVREEVVSKQEVPVSELITEARSRGFHSLPQALKMLERHKVLYVRDEVAHLGQAPARPGDPDVPYFKAYFSTREDLDEAQAEFYEAKFKPAFLRNERVEIGESLSYGYVLMGELAAEFGYEDLARLRAVFLRMAHFYPGTSLESFTTGCAADTYFMEGDHQAGFDLLAAKGWVPLETYIGVSEELVDSRITGLMAWDWTTNDRLRPYGDMHKDQVLVELERLLDEEHGRRSCSIVSDLWRALAIERTPDEPAPQWVVELVGDRLSADQIGSYLHFMHLYGGRGRESFRGLIAPASPQIQWPSADADGLATYSTYGFHLIVREYLHGLFRAAENAVRANAGIAQIGEGWVSEVALFHQLRNAFPETRVIHQGRPRWLGQQSLDVYIPEWGIGVEYQGEQHHRPVDIFGGEAAFAAQQERDARKRLLCSENDLTLIEVLPDYEIDEVLTQVRLARQ